MNANTADPVTLARNLLDSLADAGETETIEAPASVLLTLATTALDLTAKVERVEALAKGLDHEADMIEAEGSDGVEAYVDAARSDAYRIRKALNGDDR